MDRAPFSASTADRNGRRLNDPVFEILAYEPSPLGVLCLRRRELISQPGTVVTEITVNGEFLMSSYHVASEEALSRLALEYHPGETLRVMIGGLGLGYTAHEVLRSERVSDVEVVEYLPQVIDWLKRDLVPLSDPLNSDERIQVVAGDVYRRLIEPPVDERRFDLILIDVDHSPDERLDEASQPFYTTAGLNAARRHLAPGGILAVWSYAESSPFAEAMRSTFADVRVERIDFRNDLIDTEQTDWLFFGSDGPP